MLETNAHNQLKYLLRGNSCPWPHNLTLSRLVGRSLRRLDYSLIELDIGSQDFWWPGLLIPLNLSPLSIALVLSKSQRLQLLKIELPLLQKKGFQLSCWEGPKPPPNQQIWLLNHSELINAFDKGFLQSKYLVIPEAEFLNEKLRESMALEIKLKDWESLRKAHPSIDAQLMKLYEHLTRKVFSNAARIDDVVRIDRSEIITLIEMLDGLSPSPSPWPKLVKSKSNYWASWASLNHKTLHWTLNLRVLEPFQVLKDHLHNQPILLLTGTGKSNLLRGQLESIELPLNVKVTLGGSMIQEPISLFAPQSQPLPNTEFYAKYLLDQCRRLILGMSEMTILLLDDYHLRQQLTSELAADFGIRVCHETTSVQLNGVLCCRWSWWLANQNKLPNPKQLIVALLPLPSLEEPFIAARVDALKEQGRDWFREFLLPEALSLLPKAVAPLRASDGRIAILDGRLRSRSWGKQFLKSLEPWKPLQRLLPNVTS